MAHGWNPYLHNFSSLPSDHGTPGSEVTRPHPADDFIGHGGFSSANISHGASAANRNYCFNSNIRNNNSNWSSEVGHSQRNYREMAWQPDGEQKAYLPRWDSSVSNFEANVLETGGHCSIAPQLGLKQDSTVPKDTPYFANYMNAQGPSDGVSEPRSSYEFMTSTSEQKPQTGATARYHSPWHQTTTENTNMSTHRTYSDTWPNVTAEKANKSVQGESKSLEHDGVSFGNSYKYTDSDTLRMGNFDPKSKQTFVNISQKANLSENYNDVNSQTMMDATDTSETIRGKNLASAHEAVTDQQATNTPTFYPTNNSLLMLTDSYKNEKDDSPSQSSSQSSVSNDLMNSDINSTDASEASNDSQSSFQAKSVSADNNKDVEAADCVLDSQPSPAASDSSHSSSHLESIVDENVTEEQAAPPEEVVATFSTSCSSDPSTFSAGDMTDESDKLTEGNAVNNDCSAAIIDNTTSEGDSAANIALDNKTNQIDPSPANVTFDNKINERDVCNSAANVTLSNTTESDPCDSTEKVTFGNKIDESDPCDSAANVTLSSTTESDPCDSTAKLTFGSKIDETDSCNSASNVTLHDEENHVIVKTKQPYTEEKINDSNSDNVRVSSEAVSDEFGQNIDSNQAKRLFGAEQRLAEDSLIKTQAANVTLNDDEESHVIETVETEQLYPEEKINDSNSDNVGASSEAVNDEFGQNIDSNQIKPVFGDEQGLTEDSLIMTQENKPTTSCSTPNVTGNNQTNDQNAENEHNAYFDIMEKERQLPKTPEEKTAPKYEIKQDSPEKGTITSCETPSMKEVQNPVEGMSCLESEMSEDESSTGSKQNHCDEEHFVHDEYGRPLTPSPSEMDESPESSEMKPSSAMSKRLQPIVLIKTSDGVHLSTDKCMCAQCTYITSSVDQLIEHHNLQHPKCDFQLCKTCGVYFVHQDQSRKHLCGQESTVVSSMEVKAKQKRFCNICEISFPKWNFFVSHMRTHTGRTPYRCGKCKLYFAQRSTLTRHQRIPGRCRPSSRRVRKRPSKKSHGHSLNSVSLRSCYVKLYDITKSPFCKYCGKFFQSWTKRNKHVYNVHKKPATVPRQHKETFKTAEDACPEKKKFKCPLCPMTFHHHLIRNRHLKDCLKECVFGKRCRVSGRYKCPLCLSTFSMTSNRYRHVYTLCLRNFLSFLGKEITIPIKFPRYAREMKTVLTKLKAEEDQLNGQLSVNEICTKQDSQYKCNVCLAVFSNKSTKYRHIKKHKATGWKLKSSHSVDKTSITSTSPVDTEIQKKDNGSLKCKYCEKSFGSSQALKKHEFTHQGERPFYCSQCGKGFKSHVVLTHHKITHQRRIQCTVCRKILPTIGELIQHRTTHLNRGLLQCPDCPRKFTFPVYLVRHLRYHLKTQNKLLKEDDKEIDSPSLTSNTRNPCHLCSEVFDDTDSLKRHYFTHISKKSSPQCPFCKRKFTDRRYLVRHISRHFGGKRLSKEKNFIAHHKTLPSKTETKGEFVCRHCSRSFQNKGHLMKHYRGHNNKTLSKCPTCNLYFGVSKIALHKRMCMMGATGSTSQMTKTPLVNKVPSENLKYQCEHCSQRFKYLSLYYRHLSTHKGLEVHACILCGQSFPTLALCSQHEASCEGLYKCEDPHKNSKKAEIVTKSGKGEFKCKFCNKVFSKSRNLRHHILTHNEVKPYRCKACDRCFSRYDHLKMHLGCCSSKEKLQLSPQIRIPKLNLDQVGTGWQTKSKLGNVKPPFKCKICHQKYNSLSRLRWHISMFHTVKRVKCNKCNSFFSSEKSLRDHGRYTRCRVRRIVKGKTLQQTQIRKDSSVKPQQNVLLSRILPTSTEETAKTEIKCNLCLRTFRTNAHLKVHMVLHCEKSFACDCGKRFFHKHHFLRHLDTCVKKRNRSPPRGFSCAYCSSRFLLFSQLQDHFLNAHKVETKNEPIETTPLQQHLSNLQHCEENQLKMEVSEQPQTSNLKSSEGTDSEMASQLRESPYPCKKCNRGFWNKTLLRNHYRKCWRKTTTQPLDEDMPLRADIDMVLYDSGAESSPEEEIEDTEPPNKSSQEKKTTVYQCSECDKSFTDGLLLISHLEAHGREEQEKRLNKCSKCGRTFLNQARLEKHMKAIHENEGIICKYCSKEFPSKPELEIHRKQAHNPSNPYCCRLCHYRFKTRTTFSDHCAKMHPDDVFSCYMCNRSYTLRASLIRHNKKWHPELVEGSEKSLGTQSSSESEAAPAPTPVPTRSRTRGGAAGAAGVDDDDDDGRGGGDDNDNDSDDDDDDSNDDGSDNDSGSDSNSDSADSDSAPYFPCHVCGKTFTTSESLEDHQRCHLGEKPHECAQCGQCFFLAGQLLQHERKHKSEFQCKICGRGFVSLFALRKHKHTSGKKRPYKCSKCLLYFTTPALLAEHMVVHREESFPCDICNRVFPSKSSRAEHRKIHMPKSSPTKPPEQPAVKAENKPVLVSRRAGNEFKYRCGVCGLRFKNPEELSEHGCLASTERPYSCSDCDKHFLHPSHLKKHLSKHKAPLGQSKYSCNQCKNSFTSPQDFLNHLRNHDGTVLSGEGFVCPVCHQCFTSAAELVFHFPNHPSGTFQCKTCDKSFPTATQLKEHEVCHNKETKCRKCGKNVQGGKHECSPRQIELMKIVSSFADDDEIDVTGEDLCFCPFCPMQFSSRSNLLEHQNRMHPNEKSYSCEICARTYARQTDVDKHMKKHHPKNTDEGSSQIKFLCAQCKTEFNTAKDLSVHLKLHAAEKEVGEYRCDMCYKSFNQMNLLRRHQESHVGQVVYECNDCDKAFAFPHLLEEHQKSHV